ncbi:MAG TPA: hypothetical protein VG755_14835 [Nannocystaceae bacterium]|nr:hypothetical protein [Nannocystaceae bacterium]
MSRVRAVMLSSLLCACGSKEDSAAGDDYVDPYMDEPLPPECRDTSSTGCGDTDAPDEDACELSEQCPDGQACIGEFDGDRSPFRCVSTCIATKDEAHWCTDDAACCDANAYCSPRGYCLAP